MNILGIETSCDETSVAVLVDGVPVVSSTYTQMDHSLYGGVVPEIASRAHLQKIGPLAESVLSEASLEPACVDLLAVTDSPGLAGALLVGVSFAQGLGTAWGTQVAGIHHLEGHICAALLEHDGVHFPFLALVVSGGHTALFRVDDIGAYRVLAQTVDDAAGEAFDKVGKLLGFEYPAGRAIDDCAHTVTDNDGISFPMARARADRNAFSFSGLKTAVKYFVEDKGEEFVQGHRGHICRAFEEAVVAALVRTTSEVSSAQNLDTVVCTGGVAANSMLREALTAQFGRHALFPSPKYCTDNAAMIARAAHERATRGILRPPHMSPSQPLTDS